MNCDSDEQRLHMLVSLSLSDKQNIKDDNGDEKYVEWLRKDTLLKKIQTAGGSLLHYTDFTALISIIKGQQYRLTKFDEMDNDPQEGQHIFKYFSNAINSLYTEEQIDKEKYELLNQLCNRMRQHEYGCKRYLEDVKKVVDCVPYVLCFTSNGHCNWFQEKDLRIQVQAGNLGLTFNHDVPDDDVYNAAQLYLVQYDETFITAGIKDYILRIITGIKNITFAMELVESVISELRLTISPRENSEEKEVRFVFYVPADGLAHHGIMKHVACERRKNSDGSWTCNQSTPERYIYLNMEKPPENFIVELSPRKTMHLLYRCRICMIEAGLEPNVEFYRC